MNTEMKEEAFFKDMDAVIWNPYLRNDIRVWEYFFSGPEYESLFKDEIFRDEFVLRLCKERYIWKTATVRYINGRLSEIRDGAKVMYETGRASFRKLMYFDPFRDITVFKTCCTKEESAFYGKLMENNKNNFKDDEQLITFIHNYFNIASAQHDKLEEIYKNSSKVRKSISRNVCIGTVVLMVFIFTITAVLAYNSDNINFYKSYRESYEEFIEKYPDYPDEIEIDGLGREEIDEELDAIFDNYNEWYDENAEDILNDFNK